MIKFLRSLLKKKVKPVEPERDYLIIETVTEGVVGVYKIDVTDKTPEESIKLLNQIKQITGKNEFSVVEKYLLRTNSIIAIYSK